MWCDAAGVGGRAVGAALAVLVGEDRDQPPVAGIEVEVALGLVVEVGLLEDEGHAKDALPEVDRRLPVGPDERDVVDTLGLKLSHPSPPSAGPASTCTRCAPVLPDGTSSMLVWTTSTSRSRSRIASASAGSAAPPGASSTLTGSGGSCFGARGARPHGDLAADLGRERAHHLADRRREDVHAADDQHVVGPPDAADARARAAAGAGARPHLRRGRGCGSAAAAPRGVGGGSGRARRVAPSSIGSASPVAGSISSAWTKPRAPRCIPSCCSHSPHSETPMSPMPIASVTRAPQPSSSFARNAGSPPPGSPATRTRSTLERGEVDAALAPPTRRDRRRRRASAPRPPARSSSTARISRSVLPVPIGMWERPMRSKEASAAPAANGPAL